MGVEVVAVPRGERPLADGDDVVVRFAGDLRLLRKKAGSPPYRDLGLRAHYSAAALSEAASGRKLPSLAVTLAYVTACGGDTAEWEVRWRTITAELAAAVDVPGESDGARSPYVGLAAFQQADGDRFFGREALASELVARLGQRRFLGVFGESGCGKSSLLRAGLIPRLAAERDAADGSPVVVFTPGHHPLEECAVHLSSFLGESVRALRDELAADARNLHLLIRRATTDSARSDVVLVVDQFEELFTMCTDERERDGFIDALVTATVDPASWTRVVLGVRADFLGHCGRYPRLAAALRDGQVLVGPMSTDELREAITGPAQQVGCRVETALVARLVADAARQPGMLPLVSHALLQTWLRRQGTVMTVAGYDAIGGIEHALARTADHVHQALTPDQQDFARQIFLRLTALGEGTEDTRRRIARSEIGDDPDTSTVLDTLARARLITLGDDSVEIAHEALIRHWPRLRDWLTDDREGHRLHRQLTYAADEWDRHQRDEGLLFRGARLTAWQDRSLEKLNALETAFLTASRRMVEREQRSRRRRVGWTMGGLGTATALVMVLAVVALMMAARAEDDRALVIGRQLVADARAQLQIDPELALLLAQEAFTRGRNDDSEAVLRQAYADSHVRATVGGHEGVVKSVAFSSNGEHLVTVGGAVKDMVFGPNDDRLVPVGGDDVLRVWEGTAGDTGGVMRSTSATLVKESSGIDSDARIFIRAAGVPLSVLDFSVFGLRDMSFGRSGVATSSAAFSPDGRYLADGSTSGDIYVREAAGLSQPRVLRGHSLPVFGMSVSQDGHLLASGGADGLVCIWDVAEGKLLRVLRGHEGSVKAVSLSPDGHHVATAGGDATVRVWDVASGDSIVLGRHIGPVTNVRYSADGRQIATAGEDRTIRLWNVHHPANPLVLRGHRDTVLAVAFSPNGKSLASGSADGTAKIWDVDQTGNGSVCPGHSGPVRSVTADRTGRALASGGQDGVVRLWDLTADNCELLTLLNIGHPVGQVRFSPGGHHLAVLDETGRVRVWDTTNPRQPIELPGSERLPTTIWANHVAFSPDGSRLAATTATDTVWMWNTVDTGDIDVRNPDGQGGVGSVAWSANGYHIAAATNGSVLLWDIRVRANPTILPGPPGETLSLAFSADGTHLAAGGTLGTSHVWNITGTPKPTVLSGHQGRVRSTVFSRDGQHLLTSGDDGTTKYWKTDSTSPPLELDELDVMAHDVAELSDGLYATGHDDGTVRTWRCRACVPINEVLTHADRYITRQLTPQERRTYLPPND